MDKEELNNRLQSVLEGLEFSRFQISKLRLNPDLYCVGRKCMSDDIQRNIPRIHSQDAEIIAALGLFWLSYGLEAGRRSKETENSEKISDLECELGEVKKENLFLRTTNQRLTIGLTTVLRHLLNFCNKVPIKDSDFENMRTILTECYDNRTFLHGYLEAPPRLCQREDPLRYCQILANRTLEVGDSSLFAFADALEEPRDGQVVQGANEEYSQINKTFEPAINAEKSSADLSTPNSNSAGDVKQSAINEAKSSGALSTANSTSAGGAKESAINEEKSSGALSTANSPSAGGAKESAINEEKSSGVPSQSPTRSPSPPSPNPDTTDTTFTPPSEAEVTKATPTLPEAEVTKATSTLTETTSTTAAATATLPSGTSSSPSASEPFQGESQPQEEERTSQGPPSLPEQG